MQNLVVKIFKLIFLDDSYLSVVGFYTSLKRNEPCDKDGNPVPWMNYNVISFLKGRLNKDLSLFEFGSGYSTIFYSNLVSNVVSIEYDKKWMDILQERLSSNVKLVYKAEDYDGEYCRSILSEDSKFDVVVVDGRDRVRCAKQAVNALTDRGVIIFDDSQREYYEEGLVYLSEQGFRRLDFEGVKPNNYGFDRTSIFYKDGNCFNI